MSRLPLTLIVLTLGCAHAPINKHTLDNDGDGVTSFDGDCDDNDSKRGPGTDDEDCDGTLAAEDCDDQDKDSSVVATDFDCDGVLTSDDCDDTDPHMPVNDSDCDGVSTADDCDDTDPYIPQQDECDGSDRIEADYPTTTSIFEMSCSASDDPDQPVGGQDCIVTVLQTKEVMRTFEADECESFSNREIDMDGDGKLELIVTGKAGCLVNSTIQNLYFFHQNERGQPATSTHTLFALPDYEFIQSGDGVRISQRTSKSRAEVLHLNDGEVVSTEQISTRPSTTWAAAPAEITAAWIPAVGYCRGVFFRISGSSIEWNYHGTGTIIATKKSGSRHTLETNLIGDASFLSIWPAGDGTMVFGKGATESASLTVHCRVKKSSP
jgi:hypothetical protein